MNTNVIAGLATSSNPDEPLVLIIHGPWFDEDNHEQATRINGHVFCEDCNLACPFLEEYDSWQETAEGSGVWRGVDWGLGVAQCCECGRVFVDSFDGCLVFEAR